MPSTTATALTAMTATTAGVSRPELWHRLLCPVTGQFLLCGDLHPRIERARDQLAGWVDAGVTHIVDVRADYEVGRDVEFVAAHAPGLTYHRVATDDDGEARDDAWFDAGTAAIAAALADPDSRVVVHCHMGVNRGPSMAYAALLVDGWDPFDALGAIRRARPIAGLVYAVDAVAWWARRNGATQLEIAAARRDVGRWLDRHPVDVGWIIDRIDRYRV
jgi:protein-tyrosine phosphatase